MSAKPAARKGDPTADGDSNPIDSGSPDVLFDGLPAAREGDTTECGSELCDQLSSTVLINGKAAVMVDSEGSAGNVVMSGSATVLIGDKSNTTTNKATSLIQQLKINKSFIVRDKASGNPITDRHYTLTIGSGINITGVTDSEGRTKTIAAKAQQKITIVISPQSKLTIA